MLKPKKSYLSAEFKAVMRKPQYKVLDQVEDKVKEIVAKWFLDEFELHGNQGMILAREVVTKAKEEKQSKIPSSAPDVYISEKDARESLVLAAQKLAEELDSRDELETILDAHQAREDKLKHGL